jgi:hypothetical protein
MYDKAFKANPMPFQKHHNHNIAIGHTWPEIKNQEPCVELMRGLKIEDREKANEN